MRKRTAQQHSEPNGAETARGEAAQIDGLIFGGAGIGRLRPLVAHRITYRRAVVILVLVEVIVLTGRLPIPGWLG